MPLTLPDLKAHEAELLKQKEHIEKELGAVKFLIEGMQQRFAPVASSVSRRKLSTGSLSGDARNAIDQFEGKEFETGTIANMIINSGLRKPGERTSVRNTVYLILRDLLKEGKVRRVNRGTQKFPKWMYSKAGNGNLFKN